MASYRTSRAVLVNRFEDGFFAFNLTNKSAFALDSSLIELLDAMPDDTSPAELAAKLPNHDPEALPELLDTLAELGAVVRAGSPAAELDQQLTNQWFFGGPALALHLTTRDMDFVKPEESSAIQKTRMTHSPSPSLRLGLRQDPNQISLPNTSGNELIAHMAKRRTVRIPVDQAISFQSIADILYAGFGIVGETRNVTGTLPLKMTPSGGARNPYEAYLLARNVDGLASGVYHYCGLTHALQRVNDQELPCLGTLVGGQDWADGMAAMVVMVAHLERTMWKYRDGNAYRVVLIEAGHVGQNIALAATSHGLTACPTAALSHSRIENLIGINSPLITPIYALTIGVPAHDPEVVLYDKPEL